MRLSLMIDDCLSQQSTTETAAPVASIPTAANSTIDSHDTSGIDTSIDGSTLVTPVTDVQVHAGDAIANQERYVNFTDNLTYNIYTHTLYMFMQFYKVLCTVQALYSDNNLSHMQYTPYMESKYDNIIHMVDRCCSRCCCSLPISCLMYMHRHFEVLFGLLEHARITGDHTTAAAVWTLLMNLPTNIGLLQQVFCAGINASASTNDTTASSTSSDSSSNTWQTLLAPGSNWYKLAYTLQVYTLVVHVYQVIALNVKTVLYC
jgi:hypothetical protein